MTFSKHIRSNKFSAICKELGRVLLALSILLVCTIQGAAQGCGDNVFDSGGSGNYSNNENWVQTYTGNIGDTMTVAFVSFDVESSYDFLYVYDGPSESSPLLAKLDGSSIPNDIVGSGNQITLKFTSDGSVVEAGFELNITCSGAPAPCSTSDCTEEYFFDWYDGSSGAQWPITNGEPNYSKVYSINGSQGDYKVTVTLSNPDGQNIDFANCTIYPDAAYTATCNDPNGTFDCDGDVSTSDFQFTYGCSYLTFGVTSDNSNQTTSITYDFEYPSYLCDFEIGDIDFDATTTANLTSYQDEIDVTADSMGVPVVLSAVVGSAVDVYSNYTPNIKLLADFDNITGGDVLPTDPRGRANISTQGRITSITFTYSNGPEDDGLSNDHAIRLDGFSFCPNLKEICGNGIDDNFDGLIDCEDGECNDQLDCQGPCAIGNLVVERWLGISGTSVSNLTSNANYPDNPDEVISISSFQAPSNYANNYGSRVSGYIIPSETGAYTFNVTGDDGVQVRLSNNNDPLNANLIASISGWTGSTQHTKFSSQTSSSIILQAGVWYYVELLHKEGSGGDHFQLYWQTPSNSSWTIIPGSNLSPASCIEICDNGIDDDGDLLIDCLDPDCGLGISISASASDAVICIGESTTLSATASNAITYAWESGDPQNNIGSGIPNLTVSPIVNTSYIITVTNSGGCTSTSQVDVVVNTPPNVTAINDGPITCSGGDVTVAAEPYGMTYLWSTGGTLQNMSVTNAGTYTVTITDGNGCTNSASTIVLLDNTPPIAGAGVDQDICECVEPSPSDDDYTINPFAATMNFNAFVRNQITVKGGEAEGGLASGGDFELDGQYNVSLNNTSSYTASGDSNPTSLVIGGKIIYTSGNQIYVNQGGYVKLGDATGSNIYTIDNNGANVNLKITSGAYNSSPSINSQIQQPAGTINHGNLINFDSLFVVYESYSELLRNQTDNASVSNSGTVTLQPGETNFLTMTGAEFDALSIFTFSSAPSETAPLVVNIIQSGVYNLSTPTFSGIGSSSGKHIIFNFVGPSAINLTGSTIQGTVFAPSASVNKISSSNINGQVIALNYSHEAGELHYQPFDSPNLPTNVLCVNANSVATLSATGGDTYLWSNGSTEKSIAVSPVGTTTYTVTVTGTNGCQDTDDVVVTVNPLPVANITNNGDITCAQPNITLTASPAGLTYLWDDGSTNISRSVNATGTYSVTVTDTGGCTNSATTEVFDNLVPPIASAGSDDVICVGESATLTATGSGTYLWSTGSTNATITVSPSSTTVYTVTVTASNGCTDSDNATVTVNPNPVVICQYEIAGESLVTGDCSVELCAGEGLVLSADPNDMVSYEWSGPNGFSGLGDNLGRITLSNDLTVSHTGDYTVTITDTNGCTGTNTINVTVNPLPIASITNNGIITCTQPNVTLTASPSGLTYLWDDGSTNETRSVSSAGSYSVTVTNGNGCTDTAANTVSIDNTPPVAGAGSDDVICEGEDATLTATGSGTYLWSTGSTNATITVSPSSTTVYTVTVTASNGCTDSDNATITVNPLPVANISGNATLCEFEVATYTASDAGVSAYYSWDFGANASPSTATGIGPHDVTYAIVGANSANVTNTVSLEVTLNGCTSNDNKSFTIYKLPSVVTTYVSPTCGVDDGSITFTFPNQPNRTMIEFSLDGGISYPHDVSDAIGSHTATGLASGTYDIYVRWGDTWCPIQLADVTLLDNTEPIASAGADTEICIGESTTLTASGGDNYLWSTGDTTSSIEVSPLSTTTYQVAVHNETYNLVKDFLGFDATNFGYINSINSHGDESSLFDGVDNLSTASFHASMDVSNQDWGISYQMLEDFFITNVSIDRRNDCCTNRSMGGVIQILDDGVIVYESNTVTAGSYDVVSCSPQIYLLGDEVRYIFKNGGTNEEGDHTLNFGELIIEGSTKCFDTDEVEVTVNPLPNADVNHDGIISCSKTSALLTATPTGLSYEWTDGSTNQTLSVNTGDEYFVTVTDGKGCSSITSISIPMDTIAPISNAGVDVEICIGENTTLTATGLGTYTWSDGSTNANLTVSPTITTTYTVTVTGVNGCEDSDEVLVTVNPLPEVVINNDGPITCDQTSVTLSAVMGGVIYSWSTGESTQSIEVIANGVYTLTITDGNGCENSATTTVTTTPPPTVAITGPVEICIGEVTTLIPNTGGDWSSSNESVAIVSNNGNVVGVSGGFAVFTFEDTSTGCTGVSDTIWVSPEMSIAIDYIGGVCLDDDSQLGVDITGGTPQYTYSWTGPNSFASTASIIDITDSGNYYVTVTDAFGCEESTSGYIYARYDPFIFSLETEVCEGETVDLSVNSSTAISYAWSANAGGATTSTVTVTPVPPSTTYTVTITNDLGCESVATVNIDVNEKTDVSVSGNTTICEGETTSLSPNSGGTWTSTNNALATVTPDGIVTGIMNGSVSFIFTDSIYLCSSDPTEAITILDLPDPKYSGSSVLCEGETTSLTPSTGGEWTSSDTNVATITNNGTVTAVGEGSATFTFENTATGCVSDASAELIIHPVFQPEITGDTSLCVGENTYLTPTNGGSWTSSDTDVATINNIGVVTAISGGTAYFTFESAYNCVSPQSQEITVIDITDMVLSGPSDICEEESGILTSDVIGGTWTSGNPSLITIDESTGEFVAHAAGVATITYAQDPSLCINDATHEITILGKPNANLNGSASLCVGELSSVTTSENGGVWSSTDDLVAVVSNAGVVVGLSAGQASFIYESQNGCFSDTTASVTVHPEISVDISFNGGICLEDDTQLTANVTGGSAGFAYLWTGPSGFTSSNITIDVPLSGNYTVVVTDSNGCTALYSAFVHERYDPFIFTLNTEICEGENVTLGINGSEGGSYQWSANAGGGTGQSITVTPPVPSASYIVTVTNDIGCTTVATATIDVNPTPEVSLIGDDNICIGGTTTLSSLASGTWVSSNYSVASISNSGEVTGVNPGTVVFTFIDNISGCYSDESEVVTVIPNTPLSLFGDDDLCLGTSKTLTASEEGGIWSSSNNAIATIDPNSGVVTPLAAGTVNITYLMPANLCFDQGFKTIIVRNLPFVNVNGPSMLCKGDITYLVPSSGGTWVSDDESVATVSNIGIVTGISGGTTSFTFSSDFGCVTTLATPITVVAEPQIAVSGPTDLCVYESTNLTSNVNGLWVSSNNQVATVSSQGIVTANRAGIAEFTFIEFTNGCQASSRISITVNEVPSINALNTPVICIGENASITPPTGGYWTSSDTTVAKITDGGIISGIGVGAATFTFEDADTGCKSLASNAITVEGKPIIILPVSTELCVGETTNILPSTGGTWTTSDVSIATIDNQGNITSMSEGTVNFTYTNSSTGCISDPSTLFTINNLASSSITGSNGLCIGESVTLISSDLGNWSSSNPAVGNVTNSGQFTAIAPGIVTITLNTFDLCTENPTIDIQVNPAPITSFLGTSSLCIGSTTNLHPSSGGTWISSDESIATVTDGGLVTAIAEGNAQFTYTETVTMCTATNATLLNVFGDPEVQVAGDSEICIGGSTSMFPSSGGLWTSTNDQVASISNSGEVTGISAGQASFIFTETGSGCISENSSPITVLPRPTVFVTGGSQLCIGETSSLSPSIGGSWVSDNPSVASVTEGGVVTAEGQGIARFTFISNAGCTSNSTNPIIVFGAPAILILDSDLCINETTQISPSSGGTWTSSDDSIATITQTGVVTGIAAGEVSFVFTDSSTGCIAAESDEITVHAAPVIDMNGPAEICAGTTTNLVPTSGGLWASLDPSVASIGNDGMVTGISAGNARFIFTQIGTGCSSDTSAIVTVLEGIISTFTGNTEICIGDTSYITPSIGGNWNSTNESVATITNDGMIIGVSQGITQFEFNGAGSNCSSTISSSFTVNGAPSIILTGLSQICIGSTSELSSGSVGTWGSLNPTIASIDNMGIITGLTSGVAYFVFTDTNTGCESDGTLSVEVVNNTEINFSESSEVCVGYTLQMLPSSGGTWISNDPAVATITNSGVVTGKAAGKTTFQFTDTNTGCITNDPSKVISVNNCINHDFNVALVNQEISGNLSTNDYMDLGTTYSSIFQTVEKPESSLVSLVVSSDGSYVFSGTRPGNYLYKIPVCGPGQSAGCPTRLLELTVLDDVYSNGNSAANMDIAAVYTSTNGLLPSAPVELNVMSNDKCVFTGGCDMDYASVSIVSPPKHGTASVDLLGNILYSSDVGYVGYDTLCYQTCTDGNNHCNKSWQMISVKKANADNSVIGADDFNYTLVGIPVSGNVRINDKDPEGDIVSIVPQGSLMAPIEVDGGSFFIDAIGDYTFIPNGDFSGNTEIIYTLCDDNMDIACRNATIHVLVFDDIALKIRIYLEGALMNNEDETTSQGKPMMTDNLRESLFNGENCIPEIDPYSVAFSPFSNLPSNYQHLGPHMMTENTTISDFDGVMNVTGDDAIVDWIHVELRSKNDMADAFASRSGLLQRDGDIVDLDGVSPLRFQGINVDSFYVVVKHRSHLGVMSQKIHFGTFVDFTDNDFPIFDFGTTKDDGYDYSGLAMKENYKSGYRACWAGDLDSNGKIKFSAPSDDQVYIYQDVLFSSPQFLINYDFALGYYTGDFDMNGKAKYENPNDDKNLLFAQLLFYPLNTNYISNFDFFIQQVPVAE